MTRKLWMAELKPIANAKPAIEGYQGPICNACGACGDKLTLSGTLHWHEECEADGDGSGYMAFTGHADDTAYCDDCETTVGWRMGWADDAAE